MSKGIGVKVGIDGEKDFRQSISNINATLKTMTSELKNVSSRYLDNDKSVDAYTEKNKVLNKQLETNEEKLKKQKDALANAIETYGEASSKTEYWKQAINNTETEINKLNHQINSNEKAIKDANNPIGEMGDNLKDVDKNAQGAGTSTLTLGDIIKANLASEAIIGGVKMLANAMKSVVTGVVDIGKQSLESYAEYEQLIGGVETLFGDSSTKVEEYANNAYKTAGLGANEYMETVTSFSASLLQSLNGDTAKSAEVADMAITDMADNANKMGTSMESIQTAYQGFAKQNYTMLDNLKLGYGGTKGEMERLLKDAQKITGTKYDISNLNDVYSAIHAVQTEMGITGTTAKEASQTIGGSITSMKSAYGNLLAGLANGNADMGQLVTNLIDSAMTALDNIIPAAESMVNGLVTALYEAVPKIVEMIPVVIDMLVSLIADNAVFIIDAGRELLMGLITGIVDNLPKILNAAISIVAELAFQIGNMLPELIPTLIDAVLMIVDTLIDNIDLLIDAAIAIIMGLTDGLIAALPRLIEKLPMIIEKIVDAIIRNAPKILKAGAELISKLAQAFTNNVPMILTSIGGMMGNVIRKITSINWLQVGKDIISGIGKGIGSMATWLVNSAVAVAKGALNGIKKFFGIKSPSRKMRDEVGVHLASGIGVGFENEMDSVAVDMQDAIPSSFETNSVIKSSMAVDPIAHLNNSIQQLLNKDTNIYLDGNKLVGGTGDRFNRFLANDLALSGRGV